MHADSVLQTQLERNKVTSRFASTFTNSGRKAELRAAIKKNVSSAQTALGATVRGSIVISFTNLIFSTFYQLILTVQGQGRRSLEDVAYDIISRFKNVDVV